MCSSMYATENQVGGDSSGELEGEAYAELAKFVALYLDADDEIEFRRALPGNIAELLREAGEMGTRHRVGSTKTYAELWKIAYGYGITVTYKNNRFRCRGPVPDRIKREAWINY